MMIFGDNDLWEGRAARDSGFWLRRGKAFNLTILKMTGTAEFQLKDSNREIHGLKLTPWGQLFLNTCRQGFMDSLKVSTDHLLEDLAEAILDAFDFDCDHLYHFQYLNPFGADRMIGHSAVDFCDAFVTETRLRQLEPVPGMKITFVFDYGDNWEFDIVVMYGSEESTSDIQVI